ncbi:glycolate oxidase subunit GlcF [Indioceanicola profundi]|uniref:glycolate oxidase subunit GlcF n=1 Tax=Indioceanicola profundi TaxID=2220096 RepID=UPI000E6AC1B5|nr:glycolate oxidase subunit GlcF [Indioceanicola profundi]
MQTNFTLAQLADSDVAESEKILRKCVHCGFCTATCPTYTQLGDELDSPRGRIYLIKEMLENDRPADEVTVKHIDRCLSCLSCMTTCPSGVHYMHLVDHARHHIAETYQRPLPDRVQRRMLTEILPYTDRFRWALRGAKLGKTFAGVMPARLKTMLTLAPGKIHGPSRQEKPGVFPAEAPKRMRVALLSGCVQPVLDPDINEATIRLLNRLGAEVVIAEGTGCCGALTHHMGAKESQFAPNNVRAWVREMDGKGLDAIVITASGCGTTVKDYGFMLRDDPELAEKAAKISSIAKDITEVLAMLGLPETAKAPEKLRVAYHSACSMQHGQKIKELPGNLLKQAGFEVVGVPEGHICCGSAGTYNILQPELAGQLRERKVRNIESVRPDLVATGNIGCMTQIAQGTGIPLVHTVELLDWATGGPKPAKLAEARVPEVAAE